MRGSAAHWLAEPTPWNETIHPGFSPSCAIGDGVDGLGAGSPRPGRVRWHGDRIDPRRPTDSLHPRDPRVTIDRCRDHRFGYDGVARLPVTEEGDCAMSIRRIPSGSWMVDVQIKTPDGAIMRHRQVSPVQTKRAAEQYEREVRALLVARDGLGVKPLY